MKNVCLSRDITTIMKGIAILFIVLHNFFHMSYFGFSLENEMTFSLDKTHHYFNSINSLSTFFPETISFIGWVGVCVFVFVSGYGVAMKYNTHDIRFKEFVLYNYKKLFVLMLPTILFFMIFNIYRLDYIEFVRNLMTMTLFHNLWCTYVHILPGSFWYLGLALQLYLVYYFVRRISSSKIIMGGGICIILQMIVFNVKILDDSILSWLRHNYIGWCPIFLLGFLMGQKSYDVRDVNIWISPVLLCLLMLAMLFMNYNFYTWLFIPFVAVTFFVVFALAVQKSNFLRVIFMFIGHYSAYIFVAHPIAKRIDQHFCYSIDLFPRTVLYVCTSLLLAIGYKWLTNKILVINK